MTLHVGRYSIVVDAEGVTVAGPYRAIDWVISDPYHPNRHRWGRITTRKTTT